MGKGDKAPDAWDDDGWEAQADREAKEPAPSEPAPQMPMTRAERLAKHAEEQRKLWESAEAPDEPTFLPINNPVPLATTFKPALKVLSRKPAPKMITRRDPITGLEQLTLQDDDEDEGEQKKQETPEEIRKRQQRELQEKQRRYEEARAKIFGDSNPSSGQSTPGNVTPPLGTEGRQSHRGRGRGRGGGRGRDRDTGRQDRRQPTNPQSSDTRELFDPSYSPKPGFNIQKRGDASPQLGSRSGTPREEDQIIRAPRGPDASGRGFGFARRGAEQG